MAERLRDQGVLGRFAVDYISVREGDAWTHYGLYLTLGGRPCYYRATDNLERPEYQGHLIGALSEFGKLGAVCVGATPERAQAYFDNMVRTLDTVCRRV